MKRATINQEVIAFEDIGSGTPILFIHPPGMGRKVFYEQRSLSAHFRMILPDLAGQGDSTFHSKSEISIKRYGEDIIGLMDHLEIDSAVFFGYSSGGCIAQDLTIHYPNRVKALIMSGGFPVVDHFILKNQHRLGIMTAKRNKELLSKALAFAHTKDKPYRKTLKEHMYKANKDVWTKSYLDSLQFNCKDKLKNTNVPTLLLYGGLADPAYSYIKFYEDNLTNKEIHVISGATHQLPTRESNKINPIIKDFVLRHQ
jgi:pimeloyl-ACP methyl ester carboxylesterase